MEVNLAHSIAAYYTHAKPRAMFDCIYFCFVNLPESFFVSQIIRLEFHTDGPATEYSKRVRANVHIEVALQ